MSIINVTDFPYPPAGYFYPSSACNATWIEALQASPNNLSYPPQDPDLAQVLYVAAMICRSNDDPSISDIAWRIFVKLSAFGYRPSSGFAIFALVAFGLSMTWHLWQLFLTRAWYMLPVLVGGALEIYGWVERYYAFWDPSYYYIEQLAVLTIAPAFFSCIIYTLFQIIVNYVDPHALFGLRPRKMMWFWIIIDVSTLVVQGAGGGIAGSSGSNITLFNIGSNIMLAGIVLQLVTSIGFTIIFVIYFRCVYYKRANRYTRMRNEMSLRLSNPIGRFVWGTAMAEFLIIIRGCYRTAELAGGLNSNVARDQAALLVLDAVPMMLVIFLLNVIHPQYVLPSTWWRGKRPEANAEELSLSEANSEQPKTEGRSSLSL